VSVRRTLTRNTAFNALGRGWDALAGLVLLALTPYIVGKVGLPQWGIWALVSAFTGWVSLLDVGVGSGFSKYIAEHAARDEHRKVSEVVSTGLCYYLVLGGLMAGLAWPAVGWLVDFAATLDPDRFGDLANPALLDDVRFLFRWGVVLFAVSMSVSAFTAVQTGLQRMGITNVLSFGASIIRIVALVVFLEAGCGVRGLLYTNAVVLGAFGLSSIIVAFRLAPSLRVSPRWVTRAAFRKLFSFGWRTQVSKLADLVMFQTDRIVIGLAMGDFGMVGQYRIGEEPAMKMRQLPQFLLMALLPAASDLDARDEQERLRELYLRATKYVAAVAVPLAAFTAGTAGPLMRLWMGEGYETSAWVLRILAVGLIANIVPGAGVSIALGKGRPDVQMKAGIIATVSNIVLTVTLYLTMGFYGIPLATALSMVISWAWFAWAMDRVVGVGPGTLLETAVQWPIAASLPGFAACVSLGYWFSDLAGRPLNGAVVLACAGVFGALYLVLLRLLPFLDAFDAYFLEETLKLRRVPGFRFVTRRARRV
jgi:O-antigen/teichoic acid export membrane protein